MKQYRLIDFDCPTCGNAETRFVYYDTETEKPCEPETCGLVVVGYDMALVDGKPRSEEASRATCDGVLVPRECGGIGYVQPINKKNSDFRERERERLEKRSNEHWQREGRHEAVDRERALMKKYERQS